MKIPFNVPFDCTATFNEIISATFDSTRLFSGKYASKVKTFFKERYEAEEVVLTSSCTRALEMAAMLIEIAEGDEFIVPAYTYVSSANAFELHGATIRFCDSCANSPNLDIDRLEALITPKTKAVVVVHYAGFSVDMYRLMQIVRKHNILLIEDAAQGIHAFFDNKPLGSFGDFATFSFHETKNVTCGQGGALLIHNKTFVERATVLKNCGTNRHKFMLGLADKYTWIDTGSVFNLSELCCAYLYPQLQHVESITQRRMEMWNYYYAQLVPHQGDDTFRLPELNDLNRHNAHIFYMTLKDGATRDELLLYLKERGIIATFHYIGLHTSPYYNGKYSEENILPNAEKFSQCLLRLPLFHELTLTEQEYVVGCILDYFQDRNRAAISPSGKMIGKIAGNLIGLPLTLLDDVLVNGFFA